MVVTYRNGAAVRIQDIGTAIDSVESTRVAAWFKDKRAVILGIQRQPGANIVEVVDAVKDILPGLRAQIPQSIKLEVFFDRTESIRESVHDVQLTMIGTVVLVILVIFLFLRNVSATIIPSLALPMSIIGTFAVMTLLDYSLDNLSLMALTLAVGFVVDDAIVVLENIVRHMELGETPYEAALKGAQEIGFTIVTMTISLVSVFIPVLFMSGMLGRILREFSVTICVAILVSGFISLSLTPMLASRYLRPQHNQKHGWLYRFLGRCLDAMNKGYGGSLAWVMRHHVTTMVTSFLVLVATIYMFGLVPKGFIPSEDTGQLVINTEGSQGVAFEQMVKYQQQLAAIVANNPNVDAFFSSVGTGGAGLTGNTGRIFIKLKPRSERPAICSEGSWIKSCQPLNADQLIRELRPKLASVPGIRVSLQNPPVIRVGGRLSRSLYQFTLQSPDAAELYRNAALFEEKIRALPDFRDVGSDLQLKNPQLQVVIDREKMATMGITAQGISPRQVEEAFWNAYATRQISTINTPNNQYQVILELDPKFQNDPSALSLLYIRSTSGQAATAQPMVPLGALASLKYTTGPLTVNHSGQLPSVTISFNTRPGVALGQATAAVEAAEMKFRTVEDVRNDSAIFMDYTNRILIERGEDVKERTEREAAQVLAKLVTEHRFTLYEYFITDKVGHAQDMPLAKKVLHSLALFIRELLQRVDLQRTTVILTSDHGNIEDLSTRNHTLHAVPTIVWGAQRKRIAARIQNLADITPAIVALLTEKQTSNELSTS